jgi:hypothetical protein
MTTVLGALAVDMGARTISGLAVPYGRSAVSGSRRYRYLPGWRRGDGRVPLVVDHDNAQRVGRVEQIADSPAGLFVVAFVRRGQRGDRLLAETAASRLGLSVYAPMEAAELRPDPDEPGARLVVAADLVHISLTRRPAFGIGV